MAASCSDKKPPQTHCLRRRIPRYHSAWPFGPLCSICHHICCHDNGCRSRQALLWFRPALRSPFAGFFCIAIPPAATLFARKHTGYSSSSAVMHIYYIQRAVLSIIFVKNGVFSVYYTNSLKNSTFSPPGPMQKPIRTE